MKPQTALTDTCKCDCWPVMLDNGNTAHQQACKTRLAPDTKQVSPPASPPTESEGGAA